ncbi:hypothetical protein B0H14DRAFT_3864631 [Mycena olivaceomarginata]|nr:hypothetical protein B0H14DRAFT_3864631 [Mycena olivaceomarginata]
MGGESCAGVSALDEAGRLLGYQHESFPGLKYSTHTARRALDVACEREVHGKAWLDEWWKQHPAFNFSRRYLDTNLVTYILSVYLCFLPSLPPSLRFPASLHRLQLTICCMQYRTNHMDQMFSTVERKNITEGLELKERFGAEYYECPRQAAEEEGERTLQMYACPDIGNDTLHTLHTVLPTYCIPDFVASRTLDVNVSGTPTPPHPSNSSSSTSSGCSSSGH